MYILLLSLLLFSLFSLFLFKAGLQQLILIKTNHPVYMKNTFFDREEKLHY